MDGTRVGAGRRAACARIAVLAFATAMSVAPGYAQPAGKTYRIAFLSSTPSSISQGFQERLRELQYVEGRSIAVDWRWTQ